MHRDPDDTADQTQDPTQHPGGSKPPSSVARSSMSGSASRTNTPPPRFAPGQLIADRYRIVAFIGRGGMGEVYRADDLELAQSVAIKLLPERIARDPALADRVRQEVRLARQITHRNVCRIHDIAHLAPESGGSGEGDLFITMEYVDGEDLTTLLRRIGRLPQDKAIDVARQLCAALAAAHDEGVIHRDLKPANVMLDGRGNVRLTDFGIAAVIDEITDAEASTGTPAYMAPEQYAGEGVSQRSDIYALGLVIYELLTGKPAWKAESLAELRTLRSASGTPPALTATTRDDIDPALAALVDRCLEPDPNDRPASALAVAAALPGADPLAAALAAGETPSPELIAASGGKGVVPPKVAAAIVAINILLVTTAVFLSRGTTLLTLIPPPPAPQIMRETALNTIEQLGYETTDTDSARLPIRDSWITSAYAITETQSAIRAGTLDDWSGLGSHFSTPIRYWLRLEPGGFQTTNPAGVVTPTDPPLTNPGSTYIQIDTNRNLKSFYRKAPTRISSPTDEEPDWAIPFALAGLDIADFQPIESRRQAGTDADTRRGWTGHYPTDQSGLEPAGINVYAASFNGLLCEFDIVGNDDVPDTAQSQTEDTQQVQGEQDSEPAIQEDDAATNGRAARIIQTVARYITFTIITLIAAILAYRNIRNKKSDIRRTVRLGVTVFALTAITAVLAADTFTSGMTLIFGPFPIYAFGLGFCFVAVVCYIAIEPLARSKWPNSLVSWTRLFSGSFRDPMIGRDTLIGITASATLIAVSAFAQFLTPHLTDSMGPDAYPPNAYGIIQILDGPKTLIAQITTQIAVGFLNSAAIAVLILLTMVVFAWCKIRRRWPALITVAIFSMLQSLSAPNYSILDRAGLMFGNVLIVVLLDRVGLLATAVAIASSTILSYFISAAPYDQWWAPAGLIPAILIAALLLYAYRTTTAGRSLFD